MSEDCICGHKAEEHSRTGECGLCACACYEAKSHEQRRQVLGESESIYPLVREIRRLAESRKVKCPGIEIAPGAYSGCEGPPELTDCPVCLGAREIPDPAFAGLLDVVRVSFTCAGASWTQTRNWDGMPKGALAGALIHAVVLLLSPDQSSFCMDKFSLQDGSDAAVAQAVLAFLKELP